MKYGDKARIAITGVDRKGRGTGTIGNRKAVAYFTIPEEIIDATMVKRGRGAAHFSTDAIVTPSPHRIKAPCPYAGKCGGCAWQQFDYAHQLELKKGLLNEALEAAGTGIRIDAVEPAPEIFYYRNRMDFTFGRDGELGLKEPGHWNRYVNLESCHLLSKGADTVLALMREHMRKFDIQPWDADRQEGYLRYCVIREGKRTNERMVTIVTSVGKMPEREALIEALKPHATTIYHGINPTITDVSYVDQLELLHGNEFMKETVDGKTFLIHPNSFFQTNSVMADRLVATVREFLVDKKPETLLDLYCGGGMFGIALASNAMRVVGVEIEPAAIEMAKKNAELNGITNTEFFAAKSEKHSWDELAPDTVIIDPPRAGLHPNVITDLLRNRPPRLIYVSCNIERFAAEWAALGTAYRIERIRALDLFPHSPHAEVVALLTKI
jgi:23S rRNA (uracil-5-)-methyltransferase RumA